MFYEVFWCLLACAVKHLLGLSWPATCFRALESSKFEMTLGWQSSNNSVPGNLVMRSCDQWIIMAGKSWQCVFVLPSQQQDILWIAILISKMMDHSTSGTSFSHIASCWCLSAHVGIKNDQLWWCTTYHVLNDTCNTPILALVFLIYKRCCMFNGKLLGRPTVHCSPLISGELSKFIYSN